MDQPVRSAWRLTRLAAGCLALASAAAIGAGLPDPMRPPPALTAADGAASVSGLPVLQSVMLSPSRKVAIISGQTVALGEHYQGARLVRISEGEAVLRNGSEVQVLKLFPDLEKQPLSGRTSGKVSRHSQAQK
ncbi:MAG TPA: hypothetical protein VL051_05220 [Burkholderiaceae bacterium]|nr:hypothetical protein [Burkholderiaceae bacterium]